MNLSFKRKFEQIYIAAPFFNPAQLERVEKVEELLKAKNINFFSPRSFGVIKDMTPEEKQARMKSIFDENVKQINNSCTLIVILDEPDTGTIWELGFAAGQNNIWRNIDDEGFRQDVNYTIITVSFTGKPVNVMLRYCIDYHAESFSDLEKILNGLENGKLVETDMPEVNE